MNVTLSCGVKVGIAAFHFVSRTTLFEGVLEGTPKGFNRHLLELAPVASERLWGNKKTLLIMPTFPIMGGDDPSSRDYREHLEFELLPPYVLSAWLRERIDTGDSVNFRELVIIFLRDDLDETIPEMVQKTMNKLDWKSSSTLITHDW